MGLLPPPSLEMHQQDISCFVLYDELAYGDIAWPLLGPSEVTYQVRSGCLFAGASSPIPPTVSGGGTPSRSGCLPFGCGVRFDGGISLLERCTEHGILMATGRQAVRVSGGKSCH